MKKVVLTGPESTGKTTLANHLSQIFEVGSVEEYARKYLEQLDRPYTQSDLKEIAQGQILAENEQKRSSDKLICDTDLLTIKVWSEFKYASCDPWIIEQLKKRMPDLYLICYPDLEWQFDPQRENPNDVKELFEIYLAEVKKLKVSYEIIQGKGESRFKRAEEALRKIKF